MTSRRKGREATGKGLTSATLPATTVVTNIPAPVEVRGRAMLGQTVCLLVFSYYPCGLVIFKCETALTK